MYPDWVEHSIWNEMLICIEISFGDDVYYSWTCLTVLFNKVSFNIYISAKIVEGHEYINLEQVSIQNEILIFCDLSILNSISHVTVTHKEET